MHQPMKTVVLSLGLLMFFTAGPTRADHPQMPGVKVEQLLNTVKAWDGTPYAHYPDGKPELSVLRYSIPAHTNLPWHTHAVPNVAYIVSGEITVEKQASGEKKVFKTGETIAEVVDVAHRGYTGAQPAELVVFYAGGAGLALVTKQDQQKTDTQK